MLAHYVRRLQLSLQCVEKMELISRTSELARVFGIDFFSVVSRGSQFRVESMLSRLARTQGFAMPSPDRERVRTQPALECLPLNMEPESRFYASPVCQHGPSGRLWPEPQRATMG